MADVAQKDKRSVDRMMVRIEHLDNLLGLAGEVIITGSTLHELQRTLQDSASRSKPIGEADLETVKTTTEATRRISQELHNLVMAIRLVEIGETFRLFRRPVRDLARRLGRTVELTLQGEDALIDKALAERLVDPLLHLVRNAIDHGIEPPLERARADKPQTGVLTVTAIDREHDTEITVHDDGRGIDEAAIRSRLAERGGPDPGAEMPLLDIISQVGFSTREDVSDTSGRGVGLDIVRKAMEEMDGTLALTTTPGAGTTFTLTIPKLRAVNIVDALTVRAGDNLYAFPIENVVSFLGIAPEEIQTALDRQRYITHLGEVVVLKNLIGLLDGTPTAEAERPLPIAIIEGKGGRLALVVDELLGPQKLVNVPLDERVFHVQGVMGTSVFAGGHVGLSLDPDALTQRGLGATAKSPPPSASPAPQAERAAAPPPDAAPPPQASGGGPTAAAPTGGLRADDISELAEELRRGLADLQDVLLALERAPEDAGTVNHAFRLLHGAKGNFTMLECEAAAEVAHQLETILDYLRSGRTGMTPERMDLCLDGVSHLNEAAQALPDEPAPPPADLLERLAAEVARRDEERVSLSDRDLVGQAFALTPTIELQVLSALKRGETTLETFIAFEPGRQADFLVAYLILRRIGLHGTVLASLPPVDEIEKGECGTALKLLWSTPLTHEELDDLFLELGPLYSIMEHHSTPTAVFQV